MATGPDSESASQPTPSNTGGAESQGAMTPEPTTVGEGVRASSGVVSVGQVASSTIPATSTSQQPQAQGMVVRGKAQYEGQGYVDGLFVGVFSGGWGLGPCLQTQTLADGSFEVRLTSDCFEEGQEVFFTTGGLPACPLIRFRSGTLTEVELVGSFTVTGCDADDSMPTENNQPTATNGGSESAPEPYFRLQPFYPEEKALLEGGGYDFRSAVLVDLNEDGILDVATAKGQWGVVSVLMGRGDGTFESEMTYEIEDNVASQRKRGRIPSYLHPQVISAADVDKDDHVDLLVASQMRFGPSALTVLIGDGTGGVVREGEFLLSDGRSFSMAHADLDGDGHLDVVTADVVGLSVLMGNGDGTFKPNRVLSSDSGPVWVAAEDLDRNGIVDLVTANQASMDISVRMGTGGGEFSAERHFAVAGRQDFHPSEVIFGDFNITLADMNRDGVLDVISTENTGTFFLLGNGDGSFGAPTSILGGGIDGIWSGYPVVADLNSDGFLDIIRRPSSVNFERGTSRGEDRVGVMLALGETGFESAMLYRAADQTHSILVGDLTSDGKPDILTIGRMSGGRIGLVTLVARGDGSFEQTVRIRVEGEPTWVATGDLNGDGRSDIVTVFRERGVIEVFLQSSDGQFELSGQLEVGIKPVSVSIADMSSDDVPDLIVGFEGSEQISILRGNGDGSFDPGSEINVGDDPVGIAVADLNGDGVRDILTTNRLSNDISIVIGRVDGTFEEERRYQVGDGPAAVAIADLNRDDVLDVAVANQASGDLSILLGDGRGGFLQEQRVQIPGCPHLFPEPRSRPRAIAIPNNHVNQRE